MSKKLRTVILAQFFSDEHRKPHDETLRRLNIQVVNNYVALRDGETVKFDVVLEKGQPPVSVYYSLVTCRMYRGVGPEGYTGEIDIIPLWYGKYF